MKAIVSVIIPAYNSERSIEKCIKSLLDQTLSNFEMYIIDDGSTDNTLKIAQKFNFDYRVHIISQNNKGVSAARNNALGKVKTKYVTFVDSDDFVSSKYLERLVAGIKIDQVDMAICNIPSNFLNLSKNSVVKSQKVMNMLLSPKGMGGYLWNKIFKTDIIKRYNICFNDKLYIAEDLLFCEQYLSYIGNVNLLTTHDYHYIENSNSVSNNMSFKKNNIDFYLNYLEALERILTISSLSFDDVKKNVRARMCDLCCDIVRIINLNNDINDKNIKNKSLQYINDNKCTFFKSTIISYKRKLVLILLIISPILIRSLDEFKNK